MWKFIKNSKFYQINEYGEIKNIGGRIIRRDGKPYNIKPCLLKFDKVKCGYLLVDLKIDIKEKCCVHRLVLETFNPVKNMKDLQVNHIDGNKSNNNLTNLEWCSRKENMQHALKNGLFKPQNRHGEKHPMCKISSKDVEEIRKMIKSKKYTQHQIALNYGVSDTTISEIKTNKKRKID